MRQRSQTTRYMRNEIVLILLLILLVTLLLQLSISAHNNNTVAKDSNESDVVMDSPTTLLRLHQEQELLTILCVDKTCLANCTQYLSPVKKCYNGQNLVPSSSDNPFGAQDILDEVIHNRNAPPKAFKRLFFDSTNGSCSGKITDSFNYIPLNECIGPFGPPRPCGTFHLLDDSVVKDA